MTREPEERPWPHGWPYAVVSGGLFLLAIAWSYAP